MQDEWHLLGSIKIGRFAIGTLLFTDESRFTLSTCDSADTVENIMLPAASSSMTGLVVGQSWYGEAFLWIAAQLSVC